MTENAVEPDRNPEIEKRLIEMQTFLLAYLTAKVSQSFSVSEILKTAFDVSALLNECTVVMHRLTLMFPNLNVHVNHSLTQTSYSAI